MTQEAERPSMVEWILHEEDVLVEPARATTSPAEASSCVPEPDLPEVASTDSAAEASTDSPDKALTDPPEAASTDAPAEDEHVAETSDATDLTTELETEDAWQSLEAVGYSMDELLIDEACDPDLLDADAEFVTVEPAL